MSVVVFFFFPLMESCSELSAKMGIIRPPNDHSFLRCRSSVYQHTVSANNLMLCVLYSHLKKDGIIILVKFVGSVLKPGKINVFAHIIVLI